MYFPSMRLESDKRRKLFRAIVVYPGFNVESRKSLFESGLVLISAKPVLGRLRVCVSAALFLIFEKSFSNFNAKLVCSQHTILTTPQREELIRPTFRKFSDCIQTFRTQLAKTLRDLSKTFPFLEDGISKFET